MLVVTIRVDKGERKDWVDIETPSGEVISVYLKRTMGQQARIGFHTDNREVKITRQGSNAYENNNTNSEKSPIIKEDLRAY